MNERPVLSRADLEAFDSKPEGSGTEKRFRCPFCRNSERALHVNFATGTFNCKRASCGVTGLLTEWWTHPPDADGSAAPRFSRREMSRASLANAFALAPSLTTQTIAPEPRETGNWRELWETAVSINDDRAKRGAKYLASRGISIEVASAANVRFRESWAPSAEGKIYQAGAAILYPATGELGEVVAVSGRYLIPQPVTGGRTVKTRTGGEAKNGVFLAPAQIGGDWWKPFDRRLEALIIVEGQADALSLAMCGFPSMAANGVNLAPWLHRRAGLRRVFLAADADDGGDTAAPHWAAYLGEYGAKCERLRPENAKDWNEMLAGDRKKGTQGIGRDALSDWIYARHFEQGNQI